MSASRFKSEFYYLQAGIENGEQARLTLDSRGVNLNMVLYSLHRGAKQSRAP